jgi:hypothetical protein
MNKHASSYTLHKIKPEYYVTSVSITDVLSARNGLRYCHVRNKSTVIFNSHETEILCSWNCTYAVCCCVCACAHANVHQFDFVCDMKSFTVLRQYDAGSMKNLMLICITELSMLSIYWTTLNRNGATYCGRPRLHLKKCYRLNILNPFLLLLRARLH